jgi:hypothetical protein
MHNSTHTWRVLHTSDRLAAGSKVAITFLYCLWRLFLAFLMTWWHFSVLCDSVHILLQYLRDKDVLIETYIDSSMCVKIGRQVLNSWWNFREASHSTFVQSDAHCWCITTESICAYIYPVQVWTVPAKGCYSKYHSVSLYIIISLPEQIKALAIGHTTR